MKRYSKRDQRLLASWAIACAQRVLPLFERVAPDDDRPRAALAVGRAWVRTGVFRMPAIRGASLGAHAAANQVDAPAAKAAAHAAGQAVATAHVTQHAYGAAYYALRAIAAVQTAVGTPAIAKALQRERAWQDRRLPGHLRKAISRRIVVETGRKVVITIDKGRGF